MRETFPTVSTFEWFLSAVNSNVLLEFDSKEKHVNIYLFPGEKNRLHSRKCFGAFFRRFKICLSIKKTRKQGFAWCEAFWHPTHSKSLVSDASFLVFMISRRRETRRKGEIKSNIRMMKGTSGLEGAEKYTRGSVKKEQEMPAELYSDGPLSGTA